MTASAEIRMPTRKLSQAFVDLLRSLKPGQKIQVMQTVRVGKRKWTTTTSGTFREINYLATGVTTSVAEDDIVVPMVHFTKENGELSSVAIDENSEVKVV